MRKHSWICCAVLAGVALFSTPGARSAPPSSTNGDRKLYKWVDDQGVNHYGDHVPPEYASQEQHIMNSQGVETGRVDAQRSSEGLAADERKRVEAEQSASRDRNLMNTYGAVAEIERLRDQRLALLADQVKVTGQFLEVLNGRLNNLRIASMRFRPYSDDAAAPPMTDQVADDLVRVGVDIRTQEENLREKRSEESAMSKQFESDIARFKQLKGIH